MSYVVNDKLLPATRHQLPSAQNNVNLIKLIQFNLINPI